MSQYSSLSRFYDIFSDDFDFNSYLSNAEKIFKKVGIKPITVLDLACGTGRLSYLLAKNGYDVTASDISEEMLSVAFDTCEKFRKCILFLNQDMTEIDLNDTVDACICSSDGINHLLDEEELISCFKGVSLFLNKGGVFIFDINTPYKFKTQFDDRDYIFEDKNTTLCWHNEHNKDIYDFYITIFEKIGNLYRRYDDLITERCYEANYLTALLRQCNFSETEIYGYDGKKLQEQTETDIRQIIVAVK